MIYTWLQSEFEIAGTEVEFANNGTYKPITLSLVNGKRVEIIGKIDRMDIGQNENGKYLRIIDYKSSIKNIDLNEAVDNLYGKIVNYYNSL